MKHHKLSIDNDQNVNGWSIYDYENDFSNKKPITQLSPTTNPDILSPSHTLNTNRSYLNKGGINSSKANNNNRYSYSKHGCNSTNSRTINVSQSSNNGINGLIDSNENTNKDSYFYADVNNAYKFD